MTGIEEQVRLYAEALTAGKPVVPERRSVGAGPSRSRRGPFLVAAAVLVVVVLAVAAIGLRARSDHTGTASATAASGDLTTTIEVSTTSPGPGEVLRATVTVTNHGSSAVDVQSPCRIAIGVVTDPPDQILFPTTSAMLSSLYEAQYGHGLFLPNDKQVFPDLTIQDLEQATSDNTTALTAKTLPCPTDRNSLAPGASVTVTKALAVGELGMPAGPAQVTTAFFGAAAPPNPIVPITLPEPTTTPINRTDAINLALAQPEIVRLIQGLPPEPQNGVTSSTVIQGPPGDTPPLPTSTAPSTPTNDAVSLVVAVPVADGWQIGYAGPNNAFLVKVNSDRTIEKVETSTTSGP